jgi:hypothetical protein
VSPPDPTDSREWWKENWQHTKNWATCSRCGVKILLSHLAEGVCRDRAACDVTLARRPCPWCGEAHETEIIQVGDLAISSCVKLGTQGGVAFSLKPETVAMLRLDDGSRVVVSASPGLEVRAFGREDLDERGMPRWLR